MIGLESQRYKLLNHKFNIYTSLTGNKTTLVYMTQPGCRMIITVYSGRTVFLALTGLMKPIS